MVTICTASLTFKNSTFCLHSVFMCFVWIWEQTAIISLYSINWLVFITKTESVYFAVRTGSLYVIQTNLRLLALPWLRRCSVAWCHSGDPDLIPGYSIWDLLFPKWHCEKLSYQDFGFPLSVSLHQCPALILIFIPLLSEGPMGEAWEPTKKQPSFANRVALNGKSLSVFT